MSNPQANYTITIYRAPRVHESLNDEPLAIPGVERPSAPQLTSLLVSVMGLIGLGVSIAVYTLFASSGSGVFILGFAGLSGVTALGSLLTFVLQIRQAQRDAKDIEVRYRKALDAINKKGQQYASREIRIREANDPPLAPLNRSVTWQRKATDADFLRVRLGHGRIVPTFAVTLPAHDNTIKAIPPRILMSKVDFAGLEKEGVTLSERFAKIPLAGSTDQEPPVTLPLLDHRSIAVVSKNFAIGTAILRQLVGQAVLHHSPEDVQVFVFADDKSISAWEWLQRKVDPATNRQRVVLHAQRDHLTTVGGTKLKHDTMLKELQNLLLERSNNPPPEVEDHDHPPVLPHYLVVVDLDKREVLTSAALMLALRGPEWLGVTVLSRHLDRTTVPEETTVICDCLITNEIDVITAGDTPQPIVRVVPDGLSSRDFEALGEHLRACKPEEHEGLSVPRSVSLLPLLGIDDPAQHNFRATQSLNVHATAIKIPIGRSLGNELLELDLMESGDGPHGLLIGKTGSGKSELLRSIITALAVQYPPEVVNFVLVDYKGGVELEAFSALPHTVAFLTDMTQAGQTNRFLRMMDAELNRRTLTADKRTLPHLFVVIDEFAEMVARRGGNDAIVDTIIESLIRIVRIGRSLNVHLLFATQRPEAGIIQRLRGYVQYRLCLRTNTPEDSREVLDRPDAANLPSSIPGRGYLLRGDNELHLFQAARLMPPVTESQTTTPAMSVDQMISNLAATLAMLGSRAERWPMPLPNPDQANLSPVILLRPTTGSLPPQTRFFNLAPDPTLPMRVPIGLFDRPAAPDIRKRQGWYWADLAGYAGRLSGGPLVYVGDLNTGKTTALQTLLTYFAYQLAPDAVRLFVLDPTQAMEEFRTLPHCQEGGKSTIITGADASEFEDWRQRIVQLLAIDPARRPAALIVVDDYDDLAKRLPQLQDFLLRTYSQNRKRGLHLALAASQVGFETQALYNLAATKVLLYMGKKENFATLLGGKVPFYPDAVPGRGFVLTRSGVPDEVQLATPTQLSGNDQEWEERLRSVLATHARR
jgi:S-DNA-T family DNA segregation ATPase FtsK/SpoIIIE